MAKFLRNLFNSSSIATDKKKFSKSKTDLTTDDDNKDFSAPYDTRRKLSISRSGRMKQNLKARGAIANDLYGNEARVEKTSIEYHVHGKNYHQKETQSRVGTTSSVSDIPNEQWMESSAIKNGLEQHVGQPMFKENKRKDSKSNAKNESFERVDMDKEIEKVFKPVETEF